MKKITAQERTQIKSNISKYRRYDSERWGAEVQTDADTRTLNYEEYLELYIEQDGKCFYTGIQMNIAPKHMDSASLDRMDSNQPHTKWNSVLCLLEVNYAKNSFDFNEWIVFRYRNGYPLSDAMRQYAQAIA